MGGRQQMVRLGLTRRNRAVNEASAAERLVEACIAGLDLLNIYAKLGVNDRTAAVTTALERGIIRLDQA